MKKLNERQVDDLMQEFPNEIITGAYNKIKGERVIETISKTIHDFPDPGKEIASVPIAGEISEMSFIERVIDDSNFWPVSFLQEGAIKQQAVAKVILPNGYASGFLVSPSLMLTNNHVIGNPQAANTAKAQFNYQTDLNGNVLPADEYRFDAGSVFYTNPSLDFTLIRVSEKCSYTTGWNSPINNFLGEFTPNPFGPVDKPGIDLDYPTKFPPFDWKALKKTCTLPGTKWGYVSLSSNLSYNGVNSLGASDTPAGDSVNKIGTHLNIIQHPKGRYKEVAFQDNEIKNIYSQHIRYTTDTDPGSSGSPVFNNKWQIIALHHAGGEWDSNTNKWKSNQGVRIDKIVVDIRNHFDGSVSGRRILTELGL